MSKPLKIFVSSLGSRGDVQPYLALAVGLQSQGHRVLFTAPSRFKSFVEEHGVDYAYMNDQFLEIMESDIGKEVLENKHGLWTGIKATILLFRSMKPLMLSMVNDVMKAARSFKPDLIIAGSKGVIVDPVADVLNCPLIYAMPVLQMVPTREVPAIGFPDLGPRWYNRFTYSVVALFMGFYMGWFNRFRKEQGNLPPKPRRYKPYQRLDGSEAPILHCVSPELCPRPNDWPAIAQVSGFWFLESPETFEPPEDLMAFLDAGESPLYIGFGSMSGKNPERTTRIVLDAVQQVGTRVILASGWGGLQNREDLPNSVFLLKEVPQNWLFPRVSGVVHHGGAGTTAAGLRAGKPTLICPFFGDQPFWGKRVHAIGAGPEPIPQKRISVEKLVPALQRLLTDDTMKARAQAIGCILNQENGIVDTIAFLENWMANQSQKFPNE